MADAGEGSMTKEHDPHWLAVASVVLGAATVCLGAGCARRSDLRFRPPVVHVTLVSANVGEADVAKWWPDEREKQLAVPPGALPKHHAYTLISEGREAYVAVEEVVREVAVPSVLLFDKQWHRLGEVRPESVRPGKHDWAVSAKWSADGRLLAVFSGMRGGSFLTMVGIVEPPSPGYREVWSGCGLDTMAWAGQTLVWTCGDFADHSAQRLMARRPGSNKAVELHRDHLAGYPGELLPSPDGHFVAFDRRFVGEDKAGLWMLDLPGGTCGEVTYEPTATYYHRPLRWEAPGKLLFTRSRPSDGTDIYRAEVRVPHGNSGR
jgi:hypothetical protein